MCVVAKGVDAAHEELERAARQHVGCKKPIDIIMGVEIIGHLEDGHCSDHIDL